MTQGFAVLLGVGCATAPKPPLERPAIPALKPTVEAVRAQATPPTPAPTPADVNGLVASALAVNPRLAKANALVEVARGRWVQAGLRPNPEFTFTADELGDRTGAGILTPSLRQEIVLGGKLSLAQAVVAKEIDQATLAALGERYAVAGSVRAAAYELAALRERRAVLGEVVTQAEQTVAEVTRLEKAENSKLTRGDVLPLELTLERVKADREAVDRELPAAERRLAALLGDARQPVAPFAADLTMALPEYDLDAVRDAVMEFHPEARSAAVAVDRAAAAVRRAQAELIPNVTVWGGYARQNENLSNDFSTGVSVPLIVWNRNQGNIRAARAEVAAAQLEVTRVQNDLAERVATAYRTYAAAKQRAERYRTAILPKAEESYAFLTKQLAGGVIDSTRLFVAQQALADVRLERNKALGEAWKAAGELSGLLMEESFPTR